MNRRNFLAALGIGAAEICILTRTFSVASASALNAPSTNGAVWLKRFHGKSTAALIRSRKFRNLVEYQFNGVRAPFHGNMSLWAPVWSYLSRPSEIPVTTYHHRYIVARGSMGHCGSCRAMAWIDTKPGNAHPLIVFAFLRGPLHELWITSNQSLAGLPPSELPHHMTMSIRRWLRERRPLYEDGGYLKRLIIYDRTDADVPPYAPAWGVKPYRCTLDLVTESIPTQTVVQ